MENAEENLMSQNLEKYKQERGYKEDSLRGLHSVGPLKVLFPKLPSIPKQNKQKEYIICGQNSKENIVGPNR